MSHLSKIYGSPFGLLTDLYQLTMAYGYWKTGLYQKEAVFHLFYRKNPFNGHYTIASGLELMADLIQSFRFSAGDIQYLGSLKGADDKPLFDESFLNYLQRMEFRCDIDALPEGSLALPFEPLIRVKGPIIQCQLIETALLNVVNFSTLIATKSARIVQAAQGDPVLEFGLRRAQGIDGGITASRAAYIGGCHATSNVMAGRLYDIPVKGTHSHSWVMCFDDEITSFREYARALPNNCIFLVDTFDTLEGVAKAIKVGRELRRSGHELVGIRLDSGDLAELSITARKMLDEAGFKDAAIVASSDLDEYKIKELKERGAKIGIWGVGTRMVTAYDQPALGGVYKLAAIQVEKTGWKYRLKLSERKIKTSNPGILQVRRYFDDNGQAVADQIYHEDFDQVKNGLNDYYSGAFQSLEGLRSEDLLLPIFRNGELVYKLPSIHDIRSRSIATQQQFEQVDWDAYQFGLEPQLYKLKQSLVDKYEKEEA